MRQAFLKQQPARILLAVWFTGMWAWSMQTDSLDLAGNKAQGLCIAAMVLFVNVALSVFVARKFIHFAQLHVAKMSTKYQLPFLLVIFAFADFFIAWIVALLWIGPQGRVDSVLPIGTASFVLLRTPFIYASRLVGLYGLAAFVWVIVFCMAQKQLRRVALSAIVLLCVLSAVGWKLYQKPNGESFNVTLVSESLTQRVPSVNPSGSLLVVFPEYGLEKVSDTELPTRIAMQGKQKSYFLGSEQVYKMNRNGHENRLLSGNTHDGYTDAQDKYRLIPGGEDLPFTLRILLRATGQRSTLDYFSYAKSVIKGKVQLHPVDVGNGVRVGAAVCSSVIAPQDYRAFANAGANVFTNSASLKPFGGSRLFAWEQQSLGRFMAVSNARYFLQSANAASAYAYDNNGKKLGEIRGVQTLQVSATANSRKTLYTRLGEWLVWTGGAVTGYILLKERMRRGKKK